MSDEAAVKKSVEAADAREEARAATENVIEQVNEHAKAAIDEANRRAEESKAVAEQVTRAAMDSELGKQFESFKTGAEQWQQNVNQTLAQVQERQQATETALAEALKKLTPTPNEQPKPSDSRSSESQTNNPPETGAGSQASPSSPPASGEETRAPKKEDADVPGTTEARRARKRKI